MHGMHSCNMPCSKSSDPWSAIRLVTSQQNHGTYMCNISAHLTLRSHTKHFNEFPVCLRNSNTSETKCLWIVSPMNDQHTITRHTRSQRTINATKICICSMDNICSLGKDRSEHRRHCGEHHALQRVLPAFNMTQQLLMHCEWQQVVSESQVEGALPDAAFNRNNNLNDCVEYIQCNQRITPKKTHNTAITTMYTLEDECNIAHVQHPCAKKTTQLLATLGDVSGNLKNVYNSILKLTLENKNTRTIGALAMTRSSRVASGNQLEYIAEVNVHTQQQY
jgi:hypothetical protein